MKSKRYKITEKVWLYSGETASWHIICIPKKESEIIKKNFGYIKKVGGSIPVDVCIGKTNWKTSIFPNKKSGGYILLLKALVRKQEGIQDGDTVNFVLTIS